MKSHWDEIQRVCWRHFASDWRRANHYLRKTDRFYSRLIAEVEKKPGSHDEVESVYGEWHAVREPEEDELIVCEPSITCAAPRAITYQNLMTAMFDTGSETNSEAFRV